APLPETCGLLVAEAQRVLGVDARRAATLFAGAALACLPTGDVARAEDYAREALRVAAPESETAVLASLVLGVLVALRGRSGEALGLMRAHLRGLRRIDPLGELWLVAGAVAQALTWLERWEDADAIFGHLVSTTRKAGAPSMLTFQLASLAEFELRRGRV